MLKLEALLKKKKFLFNLNSFHLCLDFISKYFFTNINNIFYVKIRKEIDKYSLVQIIIIFIKEFTGLSLLFIRKIYLFI